MPAYTQALHRFVDEMGLHDAVTFRGALSDAELVDCLGRLRRARADVAARRFRRAGDRGDDARAARRGQPRSARCPRSSATADCWSTPPIRGRWPARWPSVLREPALQERLAAAARRRVAALDLPSAGDRAVDLSSRCGVDFGGLIAPPPQEAPTACWTSETKRRVEAPRSKPAARSRPAWARTARSGRVLEHAAHGGRERHGRLVGQHQSRPAHRLGHGGDAVGDDRDAVTHGLGQGDAEALVVRGHHEDVGRPEVGLELRAGDRPRQVHRRR